MSSRRPAGRGRHVRPSGRGRRLAGALAVIASVSLLAGAALGSASGSSVGEIHPLPAPKPLALAAENDAITKTLTYADYVARGSPNKREVALTFDDGPGPYTPQVRAILDRYHVPATFFTVGSQYVSFAPAEKANALAGDVIANHTQDHLQMSTLNAGAQSQQIDEASAAMERDGIPPSRLWRPPYGSFNQTTLDVLKRKGMLMVLWQVDSEDWQQPGVDAIVHNVLGDLKAGDIILMHDAGGTRTQTLAALPAIIKGIRARHLRPVTVPQLLTDDPPPRNQAPPANLNGG